MRKAKLAALVSATALVAGIKVSSADTLLFGTQADFGGSRFAPGGSSPLSGLFSPSGSYQVIQNPNPVPPGEIKQTNWLGFGSYNPATSGGGGGLVNPQDQYGDSIVFPNTSLGGVNYTANGIGNLDNYAPASGTGHTADAQLGTSYAGLTSPTGAMVIQGYTGGYDIVSTGEMLPDLPGTNTTSPAGEAFYKNLTSSTCIAYDITAPGGGTAPSSTYYETTFESYDSETLDSNKGFNVAGYMQANLNTTLANRDVNTYGTGSGFTIGNDDPGSFAVQHGSGAGSYWTVYLPYAFPTGYLASLNAATGNGGNPYAQFAIELNSGSDQVGDVTIDNIRTVSPTFAYANVSAGFIPSWNTAGMVNYNESAPNGDPTHGVLTQQGNWVGTVGGYGTPNGSGVSATFADLENGNTQVGLDTTQTLGVLNYNTLLYQYTLVPTSSVASTAGSLVFDNTVNAAPAQINDTNGGPASANYTQFIAVPVQLNSTTNVTVSRATDVLEITGAISGTGGLTMAGSGTLALDGSNTYSGGTSVSSGALLVLTSGALPSNKPVTITGGKVILSSSVTAGSQSASPPPTSSINLSSLAISSNGTLDLANNHIIINYGAAGGGDPIASISALIKSGFNGGAWTGTGITSSAAAANAGSYGIGYADSADAGNPAGLASGQIEIMYTLLGDANLDGKVNGADFAILATNFNKAVTGSSGWDQGDFNYDGKINGADFASLAGNFNKGASQSADAALTAFADANSLNLNVPEPATAGLGLLGAFGVLSRRRRSAKA
jgi:autotransporter-associated beta strand protein